MEISHERIIVMLYDCIEELNEQLGQQQRLQKSPLAIILGNSGGLDSLGFVNFVALVEAECQDRFGRSVVLTGENQNEGTRDPFHTVGTLAEYIELILTDRRDSWC